MSELCPCCSGKPYEQCCGPIIAGKPARSPGALMRSRYTAFTCVDMEYLDQSMRSPAANDFDVEGTRDWASRIDWQKLRILEERVQLGGRQGVVEFVATYVENGVKSVMHERSLFKKIKGRWYYVSTRPTRHEI